MALWGSGVRISSAPPSFAGTRLREVGKKLHMRPLRALLTYLAVVFIGGALLAPWLYGLVQWAAPHLPSLQNVAASPVHRFEDRAFLLCATH